MSLADDLAVSLEARGISMLLHFTRFENLASILARGLVPRSLHAQNGIAAMINDVNAPADHVASISLSVSCFNAPMLSRLRHHWPDADWAVLGIDPIILPGSGCRFFAGNAASGYYQRSAKQYRGLRYFDEMFEDHEIPYQGKRVSYRELCGLGPGVTTDPQAEILYPTPIHPSRITDIWVEGETDAAEIRAAIAEHAHLSAEVTCAPIEPRIRGPFHMVDWG